MRIEDFGDFIAYVCVPLATILNYKLVLPQLSGHSRTYYLFLMAWSLPYVFGNFCDSNKIGPSWAQWYLLDISFEPWATTFGVAACAVIMKVARRSYTESSIQTWAGVSFVVAVVLAFGYEAAQTLWGQFSPAIDWSDCVAYTVGMIVTIAPSVAFKQLRPALNAQIS